MSSLLLQCVGGGGAALQIETPILFPSDANIIDIKTDYGATGDGVTDDTDAINTALRENNSSSSALHNFSPRTLYFSPGTYLVSDTLVPLDDLGNAKNAVRIIGAGAEHTTIKLKDSAAGFGSGEKFVIKTGNDAGQANTAYGNYIQHLTVDVGSGNPGASGIWFEASNSGAMAHVRIVSTDASLQGKSGLFFPNGPVGPAYVRDISIDGFDYGIRFRYIASSVNNIVLEDIRVSNQLVAGIYNEGKNIQILDLESINNAPAIRAEQPNAAIVLIRASLSGTGSGPAIDMAESGFFYGRDVTVAQYGSIIHIGLAESFIGKTFMLEWSSHPYYLGSAQFSWNEQASEYVSLSLPIKKAPEYHSNDFSKWANISLFPGSDDSARFQAAIDSGAETIYFPYGTYTIDGTVIVRNNVKKIDFFFSDIQGTGTIQIDAVSGNVVILENLMNTDSKSFTHNSPDAVVFRNIGATPTFVLTNTVSASGDLFIENAGPHAKVTVSGGVRAWFRQLNHETLPLRNTGATMWNFGENTEVHTVGNTGDPDDPSNWGETITEDGGVTELLGGATDIRNLTVPLSGGAFFQGIDSTISVVIAGQSQEGATIDHVIRNTDGSTVVDHYDSWLIRIPIASTFNRMIAPLYVSPWHTP